jgi:hypothetical protein
MSVPGLMHTRLVPIRQLTPTECELLDYLGPLMLASQELKFVIGPWRKTKVVLVTKMFDQAGHAEILMTCTAEQLRERGLELAR